MELESEKWKPMILRECREDMPPYFAPCLTKKLPTLEYGEEVVYPDYEAVLPGFFDEKDARAWIDAVYGPTQQGQTASNKRTVVDERQGLVAFLGLRGQNLVFKNVRWQEGNLPTTWNGESTHCLGHMTLTAAWSEAVYDNDTSRTWVDEAAVYVTPDSERYQHFLDHTVKPLMQTAHLVTNTTLLIPGGGRGSKQPIVQDMWGWMSHVRPAQVQEAPAELNARRLLTSCRVPYVHPYLFFRLQELVLSPEAPRVPLSERKVVLWYTRNTDDANRANAGRTISNEAEVLAAIRRLLESRGRGERLEIHPPDPARWPDQKEYVKYLNQNVAAVIGPHGGGLCNIKWVASGTLVLELQPRAWLNAHFFEESTGHGLNYWVDIRESDALRFDMTADVGNIVGLLSQELGRLPSRGPVLRHRYDWPAAMDDVFTGDAAHAGYFVSGRDGCCNRQLGEPGYPGLAIFKPDPALLTQLQAQARQGQQGQGQEGGQQGQQGGGQGQGQQ
ncbi:hypothetical protein HYH03_011357 [Edaphochlamys debaryana]|uniref:Glycosyltransferase 61 catalytic domain-containing protein n=1 Tax=Edaphochlamys debaryana TaxID=47281 RepID=A0A835XU09_9CHLO|nr:hypothetical protein HYH03_011357 [Edaphochlamys debaryana]|eukprot:KAG2490233.1 hypothetical protein HYH03_011357 [Edaphochlamys debaryana]